MHAALERRKIKVSAGTRTGSPPPLVSERAPSGKEASAKEGSKVPPPPAPAYNPCAAQMQVIKALVWMPLTVMVQYQALFVQSLLGLRYPDPYGPIQKKR